jgi:hypothetical protein
MIGRTDMVLDEGTKRYFRTAQITAIMVNGGTEPRSRFDSWEV